MDFTIKCNKCGYLEKIEENFFKKDDISIEIVGEEVVRIKCSFCNNEVYSSVEI
ncbi:hypothetical protein MKY29_12895 [Psychrobacillus sp. FSL K6-2365]|uniref:hypothetical protein n=1 Tax=Psychrobacillus sp. FSL K6-2365 TaxID=2921546 RepID=UPI0030F55EB6